MAHAYHGLGESSKTSRPTKIKQNIETVKESSVSGPMEIMATQYTNLKIRLYEKKVRALKTLRAKAQMARGFFCLFETLKEGILFLWSYNSVT